jgi:hypothetical protein
MPDVRAATKLAQIGGQCGSPKTVPRMQNVPDSRSSVDSLAETDLLTTTRCPAAKALKTLHSILTSADKPLSTCPHYDTNKYCVNDIVIYSEHYS